jgi:hypothetical protein
MGTCRTHLVQRGKPRPQPPDSKQHAGMAPLQHCVVLDWREGGEEWMGGWREAALPRTPGKGSEARRRTCFLLLCKLGQLQGGQAPPSAWQAPSSAWQAPCSTWRAPCGAWQAPCGTWQAPCSTWQAPSSAWQAPSSAWQAPCST